jgi:hypothetical protein
MKGFPFNIFMDLLKKANRYSNSGDIPQLTTFLKNNHTFRAIAWKIHDTKHKFMNTINNAASKDQPQYKNNNNNSQYNSQHKKNK